MEGLRRRDDDLGPHGRERRRGRTVAGDRDERAEAGVPCSAEHRRADRDLDLIEPPFDVRIAAAAEEQQERGGHGTADATTKPRAKKQDGPAPTAPDRLPPRLGVR